MTDLATAPAPAANGHRTRAVTRRRGLPGGRAVIGGFLVAARQLGITARTLYRLINEGEIPAYKLGRVLRLSLIHI